MLALPHTPRLQGVEYLTRYKFGLTIEALISNKYNECQPISTTYYSASTQIIHRN